MNQRTVVFGLLLFVIVAFGGLIFYDAKYGHKFEKLLERDSTKQAQNWKWDDRWDGKPLSGPVTPPQGPPQVDPNGPQLIAGNYREALQKSGETGKPVLAFFSAEWCSWCKKMKAETMVDTRVQMVLKNYILVYVDTDKDRTPTNKFGVTGLPTYVVTNAKEDKLKMDSGFKSPDNFSAWLNDPSLFQQPKVTPPATPPQRQPPQKQPPQRRRILPPRNQPPQPNNPNMQPGSPNG